MGVVYHCRDEFLQREIAIKMLLPELMADDDTVEVFRQEARLAAQLEHPNIVTIHNIGMENREGKVHHYIAMEFLPGGSLKGRIGKDTPSLEQYLEWMKQMATGLNYAHKRGVVHQDIKPDNIFITHDGNLKIGDFGLALIATGVAVERAVAGKGTPAYMSPELCRGDPQDHRSDIYSLGAVFFELLTKEKPFKASGMIEMAMKHATAPIPSARKLNSDVPEVLDKAIKKMMAKDPDDRFQSLSELLTILEKLLLEVQVARLGVGTVAPVIPLAEAPPSPKKEPAPPLPAAANYAQDWENFLAQQDAKALPPPKPVASAIDPLDDLLDQLLPDKPVAKAEPALPANKVEAARTEKKSEAPPERKFEEDTIGDLDRVFKEIVRSDSSEAQPTATGSSDVTLSPEVSDGATAAKFLLSEAPATLAGQSSAGGGPKPTGTPGDKPSVNEPLLASANPVSPGSQATRSSAESISSKTGTNGGAVPGAKTAAAAAQPAKPGSVDKKLELLWIFKTAGPIGWASMPVVSRDRKIVYVGSSDGALYALDAAKGHNLWKFETGGAIVASPVLSGDKILIASADGALYSLTSAGGQHWKYVGAAPIVATPLVHNESILLSSMDGNVRLLNSSDGAVQWSYRTDGPVVSTPQVLENLVFFGSKDKCLHAVSLDKGWRSWIFQTQGEIVSSPLASTDSVYIGSLDGNLYCLAAETGRLVWKYATDQPIVSRGTLEFTALTVCSEDKWIHCIEKYKGGLVWKARVHGQVMTNLISNTGNLYVSTREGWLQCFNLRSGELRWQMNCEKRLESSPLIAARTIYVGAVSGELCAYALPQQN